MISCLDNVLVASDALKFDSSVTVIPMTICAANLAFLLARDAGKLGLVELFSEDPGTRYHLCCRSAVRTFLLAPLCDA